VVTVPSAVELAETKDQALTSQPATGQSAQNDCSPASGTASQTSSPPSSPAATLDLQAAPIAQGEAQQSVASQAAVAPVDQPAASLPQPISAQPHGLVADEESATAAATPSIATPQTDASETAIAVQTAPVAQAAAEPFILLANPPSATAPATKADRNQPASKAAPRDVASPAGPKILDLANAANAQKTKATEAATGTSDPPQQHAQSNDQSAQHSQPDESQTASPAPRAADGPAPQMLTIPTHIAAAQQPAVATAPSSANSTPAAPHADATPLPSDGDDIAPATGLNAAKIIQTMGETEMRVGMHSADFGNISIRASVSEQQMVARISLDHSDLSQAIAAHASAVQTKLGDDFGMRASIEVNHQGASSGNAGGSPQREQRDFTRSAGGNRATASPEAEISLGHAALISAGDGPRLDIRA
jgi:hypothetical protein